MIRYEKTPSSDILVCVLDQIDQCIPTSRFLIKNVSDQTLVRLREKYSVVVSKDLDEMLSFAKQFYKSALIVPTGIDIVDINVINIEVADEFKIFNLLDKVNSLLLHKANKIDLANNVFYLNGKTEEDFEKGLEWQNKKFSLGHGSFFYPVNNEPVYDLDIPKLQQLVTPAAGLNWVNYLNKYGYDENTVVRFYDYSYLALDCMKDIVLNYNGGSYKDFIEKLGRKKFKFINKEWDYGFASMYNDSEPEDWLKIVNTVKFDFVHINLLENLDISELVKPVSGTFINFSNIFSYYLTSGFYSLKSRIDAEQRIIESLKNYDCYIGFVARANDVYCTDIKLCGHVSEFIELPKLVLPTWHEDN